MTRFLLVEGGFTSGNRGVDALTLGTMLCLRAVYPDAQFALLGFTFPTSVVQTQEVTSRNQAIFVEEARTSFRRGAEFSLRALLTRRLPHDVALRLFGWADVVVDLSGGDGFGDTYGRKVLLRHCLGKTLALCLGKPLAIFPQTMGPFKTGLSRVLARALLRRADLLCVREDISQTLVQNLVGSRVKVNRLADMAFLMEPADRNSVPGPPAISEGGAPPIGVNVSGYLWSRKQVQSGDRQKAVDYQEVILRVVRRLVGETGRQVILVPHVFSTNPMSCDLAACRAALEKLADLRDRVVAVDRAYSAPELKVIIGKCEFLVGSRMHACIAALSSETPVVPISYSHKFPGILERFRIQDWIINPRAHSLEQGEELVLLAYEQRDKLRARIAAELPAVQADAMLAGQLLKEVVP